jgi:uncharacterized membrane protein
MTQQRKMRSIWYFVGLVLLTMGSLVLLAGVIGLFSANTGDTVLAETRPNLWWGAIMVIAGGIYYAKNRNSVHD